MTPSSIYMPWPQALCRPNWEILVVKDAAPPPPVAAEFEAAIAARLATVQLAMGDEAISIWCPCMVVSLVILYTKQTGEHGNKCMAHG